MILIVDDDIALAENCSMMLESYGYEVSVAFSGSQAMSKIKSKQPALLICDCCMPDATGLELVQQINNEEFSVRFPVLLMSGSLQCEVAPGNSYNAFIKKPFLAERLLAEVKSLLEPASSTSVEDA